MNHLKSDMIRRISNKSYVRVANSCLRLFNNLMEVNFKRGHGVLISFSTEFIEFSPPDFVYGTSHQFATSQISNKHRHTAAT
jgi:hypothetical protein